MAITLPSGFIITNQQPVDSRFTLTKAEMVATVDARMPQKYFCICKDDGKLYLYNSNNTIDSVTGKFRVLEGSGVAYTAGDNIQISDTNVISATDTKYTAGSGIDINNNVISIDSNSGIAIYDNRISDANKWLTNGYTKTSAEIPTLNLPPVCTENDRWGVLLYVAENNENHAGLQQYFPIDGTYKGRVFYRSVTGYSAEIDPDFGDWELVPWFSEKQDTLVSGTNIKTVNNNSLIGSGNLAIKTYQAFPTGDPAQGKGFKTDGTLQELVDSISNYEGGYEGMAFLGGIEGQCVPDPQRISNVECKVEYMADGLAVLTASSSNVEPYHWELNTASGEWKKYSDVSVSETGTATDEVQYITIDGNEHKIAGKSYSAGTNIEIENNIISAIDTKIATSITLGREITADQTVGGIEEGTVYPASTTLADIIEDLLGGSTPTTDGKVYYGVFDSIPTSISGMTEVSVNKDNLLENGYIWKNITADNQYVCFAIDSSMGIDCYQIEQSGFALGFNVTIIGNQKLYTLTDKVTDTGMRLTYLFEEE